MNITDADIAFWQFHRGPSWAPKKKAAPSIHAVINGHAGKRPRNNQHHAVSLCSFLQHNRRLQTFGPTTVAALYYFAWKTPHPPEERRHYARRWYRRLYRNPQKRVWIVARGEMFLHLTSNQPCWLREFSYASQFTFMDKREARAYAHEFSTDPVNPARVYRLF